MGWTAPATWVVGQVLTAAQLNTHLRDNTRYLKGLDGVPTIESGLTIDNTDGDERLLLPLLSTAECSTVLNAEGEIAFDEQTHRPKYFNGTSVISQGDLATAFIASQAQGDIFYASSATAIARLAAGTSGYYLKTQGAAANPIWAFSGIAFVSTGVYNAAAPVVWTDLDLSAVTGAVTALVLLTCVAGGANPISVNFRTNGLSDDFTTNAGAAGSVLTASEACYILVKTDSAGVVEWIAGAAQGVVITVVAYITT